MCFGSRCCIKRRESIGVIVGRYLGTVYLLAVYLAPGIDDVGKDEVFQDHSMPIEVAALLLC